MAKMFSIATFSALLMLTDGSPTWSPSDDSSRRLGDISVTQSHPNSTAAGCIVGGYDVDKPAKVYVGGPCSELGLDNKPTNAFKWIEMETVYVELHDGQGGVAPFEAYGAPHQHTKDLATHAEVGVSMKAKIAETKFNHAVLFVGTTSYLAKSTVSFNKNKFVLGKTGGNPDEMEVCVKSCCDNPGTSGCSCGSSCPAGMMSANPGDFKYSILGASGNDYSTGYTPGATGNGWERVENDVGKGDPKVLQGYLSVFQVIDFTNMGPGTLTVTAANGTSVLYSAMDLCDITTSSVDCTFYGVSSMTVASPNKEWDGTYQFPLTYNTGSWSKNGGGSFEATPGETKTVEIRSVKPNAASLTKLNIATTKKVVIVEYKFDVSGITATATDSGGGIWAVTGKLMAYDPTVTTSAENGASVSSGSQAAASGARRDSGIASLALAIAFVAMQFST